MRWSNIDHSTAKQPGPNKHRPSDVFNVDEMGIFCKCLPNKASGIKRRKMQHLEAKKSGDHIIGQKCLPK
jgi:hypothetical protein